MSSVIVILCVADTSDGSSPTASPSDRRAWTSERENNSSQLIVHCAPLLIYLEICHSFVSRVHDSSFPGEPTGNLR